MSFPRKRPFIGPQMAFLDFNGHCTSSHYKCCIFQPFTAITHHHITKIVYSIVFKNIVCIHIYTRRMLIQTGMHISYMIFVIS